MVKPIMKDVFFLGQKSEPASKADLQVGKDLQDTLQANRAGCVGMAANMIGVKKRVIIVNMGFDKKGNLVFYIAFEFKLPIRGVNPKYNQNDRSYKAPGKNYEAVSSKIKLEIPL